MRGRSECDACESVAGHHAHAHARASGSHQLRPRIAAPSSQLQHHRLHRTTTGLRRTSQRPNIMSLLRKLHHAPNIQRNQRNIQIPTECLASDPQLPRTRSWLSQHWPLWIFIVSYSAEQPDGTGDGAVQVWLGAWYPSIPVHDAVGYHDGPGDSAKDAVHRWIRFGVRWGRGYAGCMPCRTRQYGEMVRKRANCYTAVRFAYLQIQKYKIYFPRWSSNDKTTVSRRDWFYYVRFENSGSSVERENTMCKHNNKERGVGNHKDIGHRLCYSFSVFRQLFDQLFICYLLFIFVATFFSIIYMNVPSKD